MSRFIDPRPQVLYVEDHPVNVLLMRALFEHCPHLKLVVAETGEEALCLVAGLNPVLLLVDLRLPDCHGSELLPFLRLHAPEVPAVAVTAEDDFDITDTGFDELWTKPLNLAHVLQRLAALTALISTTLPEEPPEEALAEAEVMAPQAWAHRLAGRPSLATDRLRR